MNAPEYAAKGWQVVAVVAQSSIPVRRYVEDKGLPFNILIDGSREVAKAYGVWQRIGLDAWNIARPSLFLIEPSGRIRYSFVSRNQGEFPGHEEILKELGARS
jgi:peroxiredoxin